MSRLNPINKYEAFQHAIGDDLQTMVALSKTDTSEEQLTSKAAEKFIRDNIVVKLKVLMGLDINKKAL